MAAIKKKMDVIVTAKGTETAKKKIGGVEKSIGSMAKGAFAGAVSFYALKKAMDFTIIAKNAARDAIEIRSKFDAVFRDMTGKANKMADSLAASFGLAGTTARELLGNTADLLTGFGFAQEEALNFSIRTNQLAIDLASFTNYAGGAEGATSALVRAFTGEREALKSLGIVVSEEMVKIELLKLGKERLTGQALMQAKAEATLNIAYAQSVNAIGDYARTQNDLANVERRRMEEQKELLEQIGDRLVPAFTKANIAAIGLMQTFTDFIKIPLSEKIREEQMGFNALMTVLKDVNTHEEVRKSIIIKLNSEYGSYLDNIITEKTSIADLAKAQEGANEQFLKKIQLMAAEEQFVKITAKGTKAIYDMGEAQEELAKRYGKTINETRAYLELQNIAAVDLMQFGGINKNVTDKMQHYINTIDKSKKALADSKKELETFTRALEEHGTSLADLLKQTDSEIESKKTIINQNNELIAQAQTMIEQTETWLELHTRLFERIKEIEEESVRWKEAFNLIDTIKDTTTLIDVTSDLGDAYRAGQKYASQFTGFVSSAILQMAGSNKNAFVQIEAAFKNMLTRMAAEFLAKSFIFGLASLLPGGFGVGLTGGKMFSKFVFGAQHGADFVVDKPTMIVAGERGIPEHVRIQPAPIMNDNSGGNLTINMYGTYYQDVDHLAQEIADRSNLGFNRIAINV